MLIVAISWRTWGSHPEKSSPTHPLCASLGSRRGRLWWILRWAFWRWKADSVSALILVSYHSIYPNSCDRTQESVCGGPGVAPLAGWRCLDPIAAIHHLRWGYSGSRKVRLCHLVLWLCIGTVPEWVSEGVTELNLCSGLRNTLRAYWWDSGSLPPFSPVGMSSPKLGQPVSGGRMLMPIGPIGPTLVEQPRMVNSQLPGLPLGSKLDTRLVRTKHIGSWTCVTLTCKQTHFVAPTAHPDAPELVPGLPRTFPTWPQLGPLPDTDILRIPVARTCWVRNRLVIKD